jgi:hypothetical protein
MEGQGTIFGFTLPLEIRDGVEEEEEEEKGVSHG